MQRAMRPGIVQRTEGTSACMASISEATLASCEPTVAQEDDCAVFATLFPVSPSRNPRQEPCQHSMVFGPTILPQCTAATIFESARRLSEIQQFFFHGPHSKTNTGPVL